jgi:hypothetical protein
MQMGAQIIPMGAQIIPMGARRVANPRFTRSVPSLIVAPRLGGHEKRMELGSEIKLRRENPVVKKRAVIFK